MSTVTEFAVQAKTDASQLLCLWNAVERLVWQWVYQYRRSAENRLYDAEDLAQSAYLALVDAVKTYEPDKAAFTTHMKYHVRRHFAEVSGTRGTCRRAENYAVSLNVPFGEENDATLLDTLADPAAEFEHEVIECEAIRQDAAALLAEIDKLEENQRQALLLTGYRALSLAEAAGLMNVSPERVRQCRNKAAAKVRGTRAGRIIGRDYYSHRHVSLSEFRTTWESEQEKYLLWLEEITEKYAPPDREK